MISRTRSGVQLHLDADFFGGRLPAELLLQPARGSDQPVDRLDHVNRNADRAGLVGDRAGDRLPDPPRRVGAELEPLVMLELFNRANEPEVALLDQIEHRHAAADIFLGDGDDEAEIRFRQRDLRRFAVLNRPLPTPLQVCYVGLQKLERRDPHPARAERRNVAISREPASGRSSHSTFLQRRDSSSASGERFSRSETVAIAPSGNCVMGSTMFRQRWRSETSSAPTALTNPPTCGQPCRKDRKISSPMISALRGAA